MSLDNVGATGNEPIKPGMITEAAVKKELARREAINADPTQKPEKESALKDYTDDELKALLNDDYRATLGIEFTTFDEKTNNQAKLDKTARSYLVTDLRQDAEIKYQNLLIDELPRLDIERIKKMGNGEAALPVNTDVLDQKLALIDESSRDVEETKGKSFSSAEAEDRAGIKIAVKGLKQKFKNALVNYAEYTDEQKLELDKEFEKSYGITLSEYIEKTGVNFDENELKKDGIDDIILKKMVLVSEFDDGQKETLKSELEKAYGMTLPELAKEFGIEFDVSALKNLGTEIEGETVEINGEQVPAKKTSTEEVKAQLDVLTKLLDDLPVEKDLEAKIKAEKDNMLYLIGKETDDKSKGIVQKFEEPHYEEIHAGRDKDPKNKNFKKLSAQLKDAQDSEIKTYIKLQKAELLKDAMVDFRNEVQKMKKKVEDSHTELVQIENFDENAEARGIDLKKEERNDYRVKVKEVKKTGKASSKAAGKIGSAGKKDKDKTIYSGDPDANVKTKVGDKATIYDQKIEAENKAKEEKRKAGYYKNFGHVNQFIFDCLKGAAEGKELSRKDAKELRDLLGEYTLDYADKLELIADYVKVDDQSGVAIDKKAKTKVSIDTDHSQIDPKKLKFILENVKNMDLRLETTEQKAQAKEQIEELLKDYKETEDPKE